MAVTFNDIIARVKQQLLGYTKDQASISYLVAPMTATDTTFMVDPETVTNLSRGIVEIGSEMILVKNYDRATGTVAVMAGLNGRGAEGTTAATHADSSIVTDDPRFPSARIMEAINDTIRGVYPDLYVIDEFEFNKVAARYEYPIPAEADGVYKVVYNTIGPSAVWPPMVNWRFNPVASTTPGQVKPTPAPTGKSIQIYDFVVPGRAVRVTFTRPPDILTALSDDFETTTGFPERYVDMITYGACWRLLPAYDAGRLQQQSIEATERAPLVREGSAANVSQYYLALYQKRLDEERDRLLQLFETYQTFNA